MDITGKLGRKSNQLRRGRGNNQPRSLNPLPMAGNGKAGFLKSLAFRLVGAMGMSSSVASLQNSRSIRRPENARLVEIISRQFEHDTVIWGEGGLACREPRREVGEDQFSVWQGHPVKNGIQVFQNFSDGVDGGIWHGVREFHLEIGAATSSRPG